MSSSAMNWPNAITPKIRNLRAVGKAGASPEWLPAVPAVVALLIGASLA
jgi:hypothetical protein